MTRNNLDKSDSLYLRLHSNNPIWWQEWDQEVLDEARRKDKPIFVSVGYSSCHWCHVMAREAFSDTETAEYLNSHFLSIKVDREERPDIDQFMMKFIVEKTGSGGWPLNVFLTPDLKPILAFTYIPASSKRGDTLLSIAEKVHSYHESGSTPPPFDPSTKSPRRVKFHEIAPILTRAYDSENAGFGGPHKFPPHSTLLFMLNNLSVNESSSMEKMTRDTLKAMQFGGLNDHLQGGIFRYCVDSRWKIPHFEKMLYDQAMALWNYSLAYGVFRSEEYRTMAEDIIRCLDESFYCEGLYLNSIDADTDHQEGQTYLWRYEELKEILGEEDLETLSRTYYITPEGNFEGKIHLIRRNANRITDIEEKLLGVRKQRPQPHADRKYLCGINALVIAGLIQSSQHLDAPEHHKQASDVMRRSLDIFWKDGSLAHSMSNDKIQSHNFLFDAAAVLLALTTLSEKEDRWKTQMREVLAYVRSFKEKSGWLEGDSDDFLPVPASWYDHPIPSSISLAHLGITRAQLVLGEKPSYHGYKMPTHSDVYNVAELLSRHGLIIDR